MPKFSAPGHPPIAFRPAMAARRNSTGRHWTQSSHLAARRTRRSAFRLAFGGAALLGVWLSGRASARAAGTRLSHRRIVPYPRPQAWPAAVRYLRVDRHYSIVDRDADLGYVLFEFPVGSRTGQGSLEMLDTKDPSGRPSVSLEVNTEAGPSHLPHALAEGIAKKLREERGPPAAPPPAEPPKGEDPEPPKNDEKKPAPDAPYVLYPNGPGEG